MPPISDKSENRLKRALEAKGLHNKYIAEKLIMDTSSQRMKNPRQRIRYY